ncbi:MAG: hypothetical protein ACXWW6_07800 [Candidatus Limnocylindrales bacterium]
MREPDTFKVTTSGGPKARLAGVMLVALLALVAGAAWLGRSGEAGGLAAAEAGSSVVSSPPERPPATPTPTRPASGDWIAVYDPQPGQVVPGTGILAISGKVLGYRPDRIVARLKIAGRADVVGVVTDVEGGAFDGWLRVAAPPTEVDAILEIDGAASQLSPRRPLARVPFRFGPAPAITIDRPAEPFEVVTTADLIVEGSTAPEVDRVLVRLEGRNNRLVDRVVVASFVPDGGSPGGRRRYIARFALPAVHPNGTMIVEVVPLGVADPDHARLRLAVEIGALAP